MKTLLLVLTCLVACGGQVVEFKRSETLDDIINRRVDNTDLLGLSVEKSYRKLQPGRNIRATGSRSFLPPVDGTVGALGPVAPVTAGDYVAITTRILQWVPAGRRIVRAGCRCRRRRRPPGRRR